MRHLIYDFYGIYVENMQGNHFEHEGGHYYCLDCPLSEKEFVDIYQMYCYTFETCQKQQGVVVLMNCYQHYVSSHKILIYCSTNKVYLEGLMYQSLVSVKTERYDLIFKKWIKQMDIIENQVLPSIMGQSKQFEYLYPLGEYYLGMGETALSYLQESFSMEGYYPLSFSIHQRFFKEDVDWVNPLNYRLDHRLYFMVYLYKHFYITTEQLAPFLKYLDENELKYLYCAMLYPSDFFEDLMLYMEDKMEESGFIAYYRQIEISEKRIRDLYKLVNEIVQIRPIEWL